MQRNFITCILWLISVLHTLIAGADSHHGINIAELEWKIHQQINRERQNYGLAAFESNKQLVAFARNHSRDMASHHFFSHVNLQGEDPTDRSQHQGWNKQKQIDSETVAFGVAENIYLAHLYDKVSLSIENGSLLKSEYEWKNQNQIVQSIVQGWMNSPPHRKNILSPQFDRQGVGVAISGNDIYVTEDLF